METSQLVELVGKNQNINLDYNYYITNNHLSMDNNVTIKRTDSMQIEGNDKEVANNTNLNLSKNNMPHPNHSTIINRVSSYQSNQSNLSKVNNSFANQRNNSGQHMFGNLFGHQSQALENRDQVHNLQNVTIDHKHITLSKGGKNIQSSTIRQSKIPEAILRTIVLNASGKKTSQSLTTSKITRAVLANIRQARDKFICQICACQYDQAEKRKIGKCQHVFCDSCLRQYTDYKISRFEQVACPSDSCPETMDLEGAFYKSLSQQLKQKYAKVHIFHKAAKNNQRLCPDEKCKEGVLVIEEGVAPKCNKCGKVYCSQCFFPQHQGACESNEISFFQNNLKFRQCSNCKAVVEKKEGCNHITCRCKYEFCYLCGAKWLNYQHKCGVTNPQVVAAPIAVVAPQQTCECLQGQQCCTAILRILVKVFLLFPLFLLIAASILLKLTLSFVLFFAMTIVLGIFPYTMQFICDFDGVFCVIALLLYPISMIAGIVKSFGDFFCQVYGDLFTSSCRDIGQAFQSFLLW